MKRRNVLLGAAALGVAAVAWKRPRDRGAPYDSYFRALNQELKRNGPMRPCMVIDLDRMDHNIDQVSGTLQRAGKHYRIVEKSLPCAKLIEYVSRRSGSRRLMSFHQPFLNLDTVTFPDFDVLMGKPLPVESAALFYRQFRDAATVFDPVRQLQWLIDTPQRLRQYLELAQGLATRLRINIEIDVGLHRGGVKDGAALGEMLDLVAAHPQHLQFSGFMGYDAHVGMGVPRILGTATELLDRAMGIYRSFTDYARAHRSGLWRDDLTLNAGGSPSYTLHPRERVSNEISVGTALLKPTHYDLATLAAHVPAAFIATPVLKATGPVRLAALDDKSRIFSWWDPNQRACFFIYGGWWRADYESPQGLQFLEAFGHSANQEGVTGSPAVQLAVDDQVFLRPQISESVLLEFGDLLAVRAGRIVDRWPVYRG